MPYLPPFDYLQHLQACRSKQAGRQQLLRTIPAGPLTGAERALLATPAAALAAGVRAGSVRADDAVRAYARAAARAHARTNCLTEVCVADAVDEARCAEEDKQQQQQQQQKKPVAGQVDLCGGLAGVPVSLKDTICVAGRDASVGYSAWTGRPEEGDGAMVRILKEAGAVPFVKTNIPITLLSFESANDVWGRTTNPHNPLYSPGGSSGGEAALLALGGSRVGIGSDVAGSVRLPAHWAGCYALKCSTGRWPKRGIRTSCPGQEGVPSVYSPMARTMEDLRFFSREILEMQCWRYDHSVHPIEWRKEVEEEWETRKVLKVGIMKDDGVISPSPACARALDMVANALRDDGHIVKDVDPPSPYRGLQLASQLLTADGCSVFASPFRTGETNDPGADQLWFYMKLPWVFKFFHNLFLRFVRRDPLWAGLLSSWYPKTVAQNWALVTERGSYRGRWLDWWMESEIDILITPPHATPALPHKAMKDAVSSCGYTFLFNLLDYTAGVIPVTKVNPKLDQLPVGVSLRRMNGIARGVYKYYDAAKMAGLPVGVQIVGQRLEEEKVLALMSRIERLLELRGEKYELISVLD